MSAEQLDFERYRAALISRVAETGMSAAASVDPDYQEAAFVAILDLAQRGDVFSADTVTAVVGPAPSPGAIGAAFRRAARAGAIEACGFTTSKRVSRHGGLQRLWRGVYG